MLSQFVHRGLKVTLVQMDLVDMMVYQVKMVTMDQKEKLVILDMKVHVVNKDNVLMSQELLDLKVKREKKEKRCIQ